MTESSQPSRRRASIGATRNPASQSAILEAAADILREGGLAAFSIEAVARRARAGKPTIYRWWPSSAALLLDVYHSLKTTVRDPDTGDLVADITVFLEDLLAFWRDGGAGAVFRSVIAAAQTDAAAARAFAAYAAERRVHTGEMIRRAQARGEIAAHVRPETVAETLQAIAWTRLLTDRLAVAPGEIEGLARQIVDGLRA